MTGAQDLVATWSEAWPHALTVWSPYVKLREPRWCVTSKDAKNEHLSQSFAMIRLDDHQIVIDLEQVATLKLQRFAREVLAHEIGHHVYCPADLDDNARILARIRRALPQRQQFAPLVSNLYSDLLINDRLQRHAGLDMAGVYATIKQPGKTSRMWDLYMRIYEHLWSLKPGALSTGTPDMKLDVDASLGAAIIRVYARDWHKGASRFASLLYVYLEDDADAEAFAKAHAPFGDTDQAGNGKTIPEGLAEEDPGDDGPLHPALDPSLNGQGEDESEDESDQGAPVPGSTRAGRGGQKSDEPPRARGIAEYTEILEAAGVKLPKEEMISRYYRELAARHLVRFPVIQQEPASEPQPEGLDTWDIGAPLENIDWFATLTTSPHVIPGLTTKERTYGESPGREPAKVPLDLYIGLDCSGSMSNPAVALSYPVLAATIVACSALRAGARVMACLSGETGGRTVATDGFLRDEKAILKLVTGYLGCGYSFGIHHLDQHVVKAQGLKSTHLVIVSDSDIFHILQQTVHGKLGWDVAAAAVAAAEGGGTFVLELPNQQGYAKEIERMRSLGWSVHCVDSMEKVVVFAKNFARTLYEQQGEKR